MTSPELAVNQLPPIDRTVFFVSDGTGITAETFGHSVLTQFNLRFRQIRMPFVDTLDKAHATAQRLNEAFVTDGKRPIVFSTLVKADLSAVIRAIWSHQRWQTCDRFPESTATVFELSRRRCDASRVARNPCSDHNRGLP